MVRSPVVWTLGWVLSGAVPASAQQPPAPAQQTAPQPMAPAADAPAATQPAPATPPATAPATPPAAEPPPPPVGRLGVEEPEITPAPQPIFGDGPRRDGFTLELGLGLGITHVDPENGDGDTSVGLAPLSLSLGGFLTEDLALVARMAGTSWFEDIGDETVQIGSYFYGAALQYWLNDAGFVGGGVGFGLLAANPWFSESDGIEPEGGLMLTVRGGYAFFTSRNHALGFTLELFPGFFDGANTFGTAINFQWQLL
jgi:hypothetical protein